MNGHTLIEHGGAWQGFTCDIRRYVDDHLTVVVFANLAGARTNLIADKVAQLANPALARNRTLSWSDSERPMRFVTTMYGPSRIGALNPSLAKTINKAGLIMFNWTV
jgi:hypothetical protein